MGILRYAEHDPWFTLATEMPPFDCTLTPFKDIPIPLIRRPFGNFTTCGVPRVNSTMMLKEGLSPAGVVIFTVTDLLSTVVMINAKS